MSKNKNGFFQSKQVNPKREIALKASVTRVHLTISQEKIMKPLIILSLTFLLCKTYAREIANISTVAMEAEDGRQARDNVVIEQGQIILKSTNQIKEFNYY